MAVPELPSSEALDAYSRSDSPTPARSTPAPTPSIVKSQIASGEQGFGGKREAEYRRLTESEVFVSTVLSRVVSCCDA